MFVQPNAEVEETVGYFLVEFHYIGPRSEDYLRVSGALRRSTKKKLNKRSAHWEKPNEFQKKLDRCALN